MRRPRNIEIRHRNISLEHVTQRVNDSFIHFYRKEIFHEKDVDKEMHMASEYGYLIQNFLLYYKLNEDTRNY